MWGGHDQKGRDILEQGMGTHGCVTHNGAVTLQILHKTLAQFHSWTHPTEQQYSPLWGVHSLLRHDTNDAPGKPVPWLSLFTMIYLYNFINSQSVGQFTEEQGGFWGF